LVVSGADGWSEAFPSRPAIPRVNFQPRDLELMSAGFGWRSFFEPDEFRIEIHSTVMWASRIKRPHLCISP
jgi:hypothetical protein